MCWLPDEGGRTENGRSSFSTVPPAAVIAASAEGYAFPTNLDNDPPIGGLIPESQAEFMARALRDGMSRAQFETELAAQTKRKAS